MVSKVNHVILEDTGVSCRTLLTLRRAGFEIVGDVIKKTDKQLLEIRNIGVKTLADIKRHIFDEEKVLEWLIRKNWDDET